ncbi:TPA: hypothetical protein ACGUPM_002688 [Vibrio vulnificus]
MTDYSQNMTSFSYSPPSFLVAKAEEEKKAAEKVYDSEKYPESSNKLMCHQEVLDFFQKGRGAISSWRRTRGFPEPVSKAPLRWIRGAVMEWVEHQGGFKAG